jgi:MscS family membrane protein
MTAFDKIFQFILDNPVLEFLASVLIALLAALLTNLVIRKLLKPLVKKTKTMVDDIIIRNFSSLIFYIILLVGIRVGVSFFELQTPVVNNVVDTVLILIVLRILIKMITNFSNHWMELWRNRTDARAEERLIPFLQKIVKTVVIILGVIFIFSAWKIDISPLLATAGIAGLAVGLAVKDSLGNVLGGLQLVMDKTFKVGDKVQLDSGEMGVIMDIGLRSMKLRTYDNEIIFVPNGYLANSKIKNFTQPDTSVRVNVGFGVEYGSDPDHVRQVVLQAIREIDAVLEDPPPAVHFMEMADFSLNFTARAWVSEYSLAYGTSLEMRDVIYGALNRAGIGIPFPTHTIYNHKAD